MRLLLLPFIIVRIVVELLLRLLFVPTGRALLALSKHLGPLRLPFLLLCSPIIIPCLWFTRKVEGRVLTGEVIKPTFTIPFAFARGPWTALEEQTVRSTELELVEGERRSTLSITASATLEDIRREDPMLARVIDQALSEPGLPNGMRWAGMRISTNLLDPEAPIDCLYVVWKDDEPSVACLNVRFRGARAHEPHADAFVSSVLPALPPDGEGAPAGGGAPAASA